MVDTMIADDSICSGVQKQVIVQAVDTESLDELVINEMAKEMEKPKDKAGGAGILQVFSFNTK